MLHAVDLPDVNIHPKTIPAISKAAEFDVLRYKNEVSHALPERIYVVAGMTLPLIVTQESGTHPARFLVLGNKCTLTLQGPE